MTINHLYCCILLVFFPHAVPRLSRNVRGKVCLQGMIAYGGKGGINPFILCLNTGRSEWSDLRPILFTSGRSALAMHSVGCWVGPRLDLDALEKKGISYPVDKRTTIPTTLSQLPTDPIGSLMLRQCCAVAKLTSLWTLHWTVMNYFAFISLNNSFINFFFQINAVGFNQINILCHMQFYFVWARSWGYIKKRQNFPSSRHEVIQGKKRYSSTNS